MDKKRFKLEDYSKYKWAAGGMGIGAVVVGFIILLFL